MEADSITSVTLIDGVELCQFCRSLRSTLPQSSGEELHYRQHLVAMLRHSVALSPVTIELNKVKVLLELLFCTGSHPGAFGTGTDQYRCLVLRNGGRRRLTREWSTNTDNAAQLFLQIDCKKGRSEENPLPLFSNTYLQR